MARYYTITIKHSQGALIWQGLINAKRLKELAGYADAMSDKSIEDQDSTLDPIAEAYKKGRIDGSIEVINGTCEICHAYPMTVDCNNAGCDK